ncbi:MAG: SDR family NAD(P)-dependent oxidoreductase [Parasphingopyxis sp.]|uniref:SDR family NAD(P)-dependent oxidoreductase n=1 Tax=Parasphingopyxis sp. TaxID=1920299 RepID=UPI003FA14C89
MAVLVTGAAGFIGMHLCERLLARGEQVVGIDNLNDYYSVDLKKDRLERLNGEGFTFEKVDFSDHQQLEKSLSGKEFDRIVHLGAQAGVRYSLINPRAYVDTNVAGHVNIMEVARERQTTHMVYASSSSVYGGNQSFPFRVDDRVDQPVSLYAATKKSGELMSETYAHLYRLPMTGLRFFTVYGPWGRPDMAMWIFTKKILAGEPIPVFNHGNMRRDFTYIDDIVTGVVAALDNPPADDGEEKAGGSTKPHALYNIGNNRSEELSHMIDVLEDALGKKAERDLQPIQPGDVPATAADISAIQRDLGFEPSTPIDVGIPKFVDWYRSYHGNRTG